MTGWRLGYACGPKPIVDVMTKIHQSAIMCAPTTSQYAAVQALRHCDEDIERMREEYDMRRRFIVNRLNGMGLSCFEPEGAFYVFPSIARSKLSSDEFCKRLLMEKKVAVIPGNAFGASGEGFVRISYSYSMAHLTEALQRIGSFLEELGVLMPDNVPGNAARVLCRACADYEQAQVDAAVEAVFAFCQNAGRLGPHSRVLLKPNLLAKHPPERAVTTHPAVVAACIRACVRRGVLPQNITVADSPGGAWTPGGMRAVYEQSGVAAVCKEAGAALYLGCKAGVRKTQGERVRSFELIEPVLDAGFIIDIPKVKTHVMVGMTCAVKNLFGTVPGPLKGGIPHALSYPGGFRQHAGRPLRGRLAGHGGG